ncbi:MAG TPA: sensor histidine kinase [Chitinophagaceae bacterium]|nr:sensor histidine kinase [Chitinophagaceae bacterium]
MKLTVVLFACCLICSAALAQIPRESLDLWLKSDTGVLVSNNRVTGWQDQSGHRRDAEVSSAVAPELIPNQLHGFPVLRFSGKDITMQTKPFRSFSGKRGSIFMVVRVNGPSQTSGGGVNTLISTYFGNGITWQLCATPDIYIYYDGVGSEGMPVASIKTKAWEVVTITRTTDTTFDIYRLGDLKVNYRVSNNQPDSNVLRIGSNGRLEVLNGDIAEIIMYGRTLSKEEIQGVNAYLLDRYNIDLPEVPKNYDWFYFLTAVLLVIISAILLTRYLVQRKLRKKIRAFEEQERLDRERQRISREMHDDIGAGLTQIIMMSESAKHNKSATGNRELEDIADTSRRLVSSMSEIIWSLNPENKTLDQLFAYMREQLHKQLEYSEISYTLDLPEGYGTVQLRNEQRRNILLVTKEMVNNAIKYSGASSLSISASVTGQQVIFTVTDNGRGFDSQELSGGNGLRNIRHRVEELGGQLELRTSPGEGCYYRYVIPV